MRNRAWLRRGYAGWTVVLVMFCLLFAGWATEARADDSPARAARLSFLQGNVTVDHVDNTGSDPAQINMPLAQGVRVSTGQDGQAEIEFEDGSLVRLTPNSSLELTALTADANGNMQTGLTLANGLIYAELRAAEKFAYSVGAGGVRISPVVNATVRIAMDQPPAVVSVLDGTVQVEGGSSAGGEGYRTNVNAGETLTGDASDAGRYSLTHEVAENSWDKWNDDRDQAATDEAANQTAARDNYAGEAGYGWSDLDANGSWYNVPGEGEVWQPTVAMDADFDPYGYGSWVWYPGRGYVWASGYSWGWTPYRCGNWSYWDGFGWGWLPGNGCGFGGWGFGGGGYVINIVRPPLRYHFQTLPVRRPGGPRPIRVGHPVANPIQRRPIGGPRTIGGHTVEPLRPVQRVGDLRNVRPIGGALRRDFPVDRGSHQPVLGRVNPSEGRTPAAGVQPGESTGAMRPVNPRSGSERKEAPVRQMRPVPPNEQRQGPPQQEVRPVAPREQMRPVAPQQQVRPVAPQQQMRPAESRPAISRPEPRYAPPPQPSQPHYAPQPPPQPHSYSPPPQSHSAPPPAASHSSGSPGPAGPSHK